MSTYAIGDVQGCFDELQRLLDKIRFDPAKDRLWFTGDLVNRGPKSLAVLRFVRDLGNSAVTVLGNHDLHLVAASINGKTRKKDTLDKVLRAKDADELIDWLRRRPLLHVEGSFVLVHAGLPPQWSVTDALEICGEASRAIASRRSDLFLADGMYGDQPDRWTPALSGRDRLRFVINCCTRLRACTPQGHIDLKFKGAPGDTPDGLIPWFTVPGRRSASETVLFGHWSALGRVHWPEYRVYGLDTGVVWGRKLSALRLEDREVFAVRSEVRGSD
ncbi:MAG TPA: symmetrical bis(5'-nucleosyl)-tetraphosphatase [Verrucomicrobiae bacterium]|nr:symmetrical bis(5'-nucleosyl)-tetraphosphatase [Verrucomicrobiae bacterium]